MIAGLRLYSAVIRIPACRNCWGSCTFASKGIWISTTLLVELKRKSDSLRALCIAATQTAGVVRKEHYENRPVARSERPRLTKSRDTPDDPADHPEVQAEAVLCYCEEQKQAIIQPSRTRFCKSMSEPDHHALSVLGLQVRTLHRRNLWLGDSCRSIRQGKESAPMRNDSAVLA